MCKTSPTTATTATTKRPFGLFVERSGAARPATYQELRDFYAPTRLRKYEGSFFVDAIDAGLFLGVVVPVPHENGSRIEIGIDDVPAEVRGMLDSGLDVDSALFLVRILSSCPTNYRQGRSAWRLAMVEITGNRCKPDSSCPAEDEIAPPEACRSIRNARAAAELNQMADAVRDMEPEAEA